VEILFTPSPDVTVILNVLLDKFENHPKQSISSRNEVEWTEHATYHPEAKRNGRSIRVSLIDLPLPTYFSQSDPEPRLIANHQLQKLENIGLVHLTWLPGETGHLLNAITLQPDDGTRNTKYAILYTLLHREPLSNTRSRLETLLLADQFRFSKEDWRARVIQHILGQFSAGKSPAPFSLSDSIWNLDLLAVLSALSDLKAETPYRVFSVRTFNDSKRFDELKPAVVRLARIANPEWKTLSVEDVLREFNLVANPSYIYLAGNWQFTAQTGEILSLSGFNPSIGFPAAQVETIQAVNVHADFILCIENLTSFHEYLRNHEKWNTNHAPRTTHHTTICLMGNPSPPIRRLLRLLPETIPIYLWSDMDYGGFNILSQLRKHVRRQIIPHLMDIPTFETYRHLSRPLTQKDTRNLKNMSARSELGDVWPIIEHLIHRGLKLEQEAIQI
jgi:hypothetical protein